MRFDISAILLTEQFNNYETEEVVSDASVKPVINNLSKINIFIGTNNSGKSKFLRGIAAQQNYVYKSNVDHEEIKSFKDESAAKLREVIDYFKDRNYASLEIEHLLPLADTAFQKEGDSIIKVLESFYGCVMANSPFGFVRGSTRYSREMDIRDRVTASFEDLIERYSVLTDKIAGSNKLKFKKLYIPTLRGLRCLTNGSDCYFDRTKADYFSEGFSPEIFTGLAFYTQLKDLLLGDLNDRQTVIEFQDFLSVNFFNGQPVALIPRKGENVIYVKIGNENEYPIYNLGDGIQSIICITFPLFVNKNEHLVAFIEEPELYMHPGLQRVLINTFLKFENHQYFLTTHSNHFLDLTLEYSSISVYTFQKELDSQDASTASAKFKINNVSNDDMHTLELLGVKNSSVFLSNCTIWVEGITDRKYLQYCLNLYHKKENLDSVYKLDTHYSFVEYSGGNIVHWSFLDKCDGINVERLCGKLFLISDRDKRGTYKDARHDQLKNALGDRYYVLSVREMENTLTPKVITKVVKKYEKDHNLTLPHFEQKDYKNVLLGKYIEDVLLKGQKGRLGKYADKSGTLTQKYRFWEDAISEIQSYDDLSPEVKRLVTRISSFIESNNNGVGRGGAFLDK
ncbi:MAG: hypothetical protein A2075_12560 [Geobacteraceae bacterium GWC2_58_44]|nr:MAG: hypothetical protein A2075_12560 [Geobacteraceae bacterium GWC2_58_44]HBG06925.1 hypothetical protein [Geobacter sp.]